MIEWAGIQLGGCLDWHLPVLWWGITQQQQQQQCCMFVGTAESHILAGWRANSNKCRIVLHGHSSQDQTFVIQIIKWEYMTSTHIFLPLDLQCYIEVDHVSLLVSAFLLLLTLSFVSGSWHCWFPTHYPCTCLYTSCCCCSPNHMQ